MDMETGCFEIRSELDFVLHFLPMEYLRNYGKVMSPSRFEDIMRYLQLSNDGDKEL